MKRQVSLWVLVVVVVTIGLAIMPVSVVATSGASGLAKGNAGDGSPKSCLCGIDATHVWKVGDTIISISREHGTVSACWVGNFFPGHTVTCCRGCYRPPPPPCNIRSKCVPRGHTGGRGSVRVN
jgi:hypothetical protein